MHQGPITITLDIETAPIQAYVWGLRKQYVGLDQIIKDWTILSFCCKDFGDDKIIYEDVSKQEDYYDDEEILFSLHRELDRADIVITQNGARFDHKKINARFLSRGFRPPSPFKIVDTWQEATKIAAFTSSKLEWLSQAMSGERKSTHGKFPGFLLWQQCLLGNAEAWSEMAKYNPQDVVATEGIYKAMLPYMTRHPNVNVFDEDNTRRCPRCGSEDIQRRGRAHTNTGEYQRYQCRSCRGWSRSRYTENSIKKRKSLLTSI